MNNKYFYVIVFVIVVILAYVGYEVFVVRSNHVSQKQAQSQRDSLGAQLYQQNSAKGTVQNPVQKAPDTNPFSNSSSVNPINSGYTNPFQ